ncbi:hypothetical protein MIZ03_3871 [Rhodoferax lithotrophicus]|uniref:Uncharacterized protein n=1 Tax=Rhodoferax lithotrophicus TaxID=2798804 RepID=A0ABN6DAG8_9BURK|nr:hypothetical protein [Rhodoferax sp. MIZ03]BCO28961.1 hypothetical protein MIZ03_3871 [Rhodoferax sp. MIZ03]
MNTHLQQFVTKYLSVVFATLMSVSFFAFLAIPYSLGAHPGEEAQTHTTVPVSLAAQKSEAPTLKLKA